MLRGAFNCFFHRSRRLRSISGLGQLYTRANIDRASARVRREPPYPFMNAPRSCLRLPHNPPFYRGLWRHARANFRDINEWDKRWLIILLVVIVRFSL